MPIDHIALAAFLIMFTLIAGGFLLAVLAEVWESYSLWHQRRKALAARRTLQSITRPSRYYRWQDSDICD